MDSFKSYFTDAEGQTPPLPDDEDSRQLQELTNGLIEVYRLPDWSPAEHVRCVGAFEPPVGRGRVGVGADKA
jgi:hypothetical protein